MDLATEYFVLVDLNVETEMMQEDCLEHLMCEKAVLASDFLGYLHKYS